jgi:peptide/nickel transport system substrate-binding protein
MTPDAALKIPSVTRLSRRHFVLRLGGAAGSLGLISLLDAACAPASPAVPTAASAPAPAAPKPSTAPAASPAVASASPAASPVAKPAASPAASPVASPSPAPVAAARPGIPGGSLRSTLGAEPTTLDPHKRTSLFDADVHCALYIGLVSNVITDTPTGALAESWTSPDAKSWTFKLRSGLTFHNGQPVTPESVKFSMDRLIAPETGTSGALKARAGQIASTTVVDPATVRIDLKAANAAFPVDAADLMVVPQSFDAANPVGAGPFAFVEWVRNQRVRLKKFPGYYERGLPYLDELVFMPTPDEDQKIVLLQTGGVEFSDTVPLPRVKEVRAMSNVQVFSLTPGVSPSAYVMLLNHTKSPLGDTRVRQAMNYAIDRAALLDVTFGEGGVKSNLIPPKSWAFNPNAVSYNNRDVAKAKQLLQQAGFGDGVSLQLKHFTSRAEYIPMAQLFQANMADVGIKIDIQSMQIAVWIEQVLNNRDFDLGLTGVTPGPDPDPILTDEYDVTNGDDEAMQWKNDEVQQLLAQGRATVPQDQRKKIYDRIQEIVQLESPAFVMNERPILLGASSAVRGFTADPRQYLHFENVWLQK